MSTLLEVKNLKKYFRVSNGWLHAVDNVSFTLEKGRTLGVVGESGCGKSTLGRTIVHLLESTGGEIYFEGQEISHIKGKALKDLRRNMQIIFQDPFSSLDPRMSVSEIIAEPLIIYKQCAGRGELDHRVAEIMDTVGLASRLANSYPHELDGGRRQRIGIGRALALRPRFIVCDEPVSALDVSIQAQILNLMQDLQQAQELTYLFITHDLSVVKHVSDHILVMYLGCMVEKCPAKELFHHQYHPYTKGLISAIPIPNIHRRQEPVLMKGELSSPIDPQPGCRFANRCPYAREVCSTTTPQLAQVRENHLVACHFVKEINGL